MKSHASNPTAEHVEGHIFRVYFSGRDSMNRSSIGSVLIDISLPADRMVVGTPSDCILGPGGRGTFDDSGATVCCVVKTPQGARHMYYLGWNLGVTVPWRNSIGLAISESPGQTFVKHSRAAILDRNDIDPLSLSYPWVMIDEGRWRMWYGTNIEWGEQAYDMKYVIKYAESADGIRWDRRGEIAISPSMPGETAFARPCVIRDSGMYRMWYTYRGTKYSIGYAESPEGLRWTRRDELAGIEASASGWDSEEICYPCVFDHAGKRYMLYNGNGYGLTGFGLAVLEG